MSLIHVNWNPEDRQLRQFAWIGAGASVALAVLLHAFKGLDLRGCAVLVSAGCLLGISPWLSLKITRAVYVILTGATLPIGLVVSLVMLGLFYFLLITPLGLVFRLLGRDPLQRRFDPKAETYWVEHPPADRPERYFQQF